MFADIGTYEACGIFTKGHFILMIITVVGIIIALKYSFKKNTKEVHKIIVWITIIMWGLEILRISYNIKKNSIYDVNT